MKKILIGLFLVLLVTALLAGCSRRENPVRSSKPMSPETERIDIAANVRRLRKSQGLTQVGLAERSGLARPTVSRCVMRNWLDFAQGHAL